MVLRKIFMIDILVYLIDQQYKEEIESTLKGTKYICHQVSNVDEVIEICSQDLIDVILIWPAELEEVKDLLTLMKIKNLGYIPVIPVVKREMDILPVLRIPVVDVIQIPLAKREFYIILDRIVEQLQYKSKSRGEQYWYGQLFEFGLLDLMRMIELSQRDSILNISVKEHKSQILFREGRVLRATLRDLDSIKTLQKLVYLRKGNFQLQFTTVDIQGRIDVDNQTLLSKLNKQQEDQYTYLKSLQDLGDDLILAKYPPQSQIDREKKIILDSCKKGMNVDELLISLDLDNIILLKNIMELVQDGYLVIRSDFNLMQKQKPQKKNLGKMLNPLSVIFKRKKTEIDQAKKFAVKPRKWSLKDTKIIYKLPKVEKTEIHKIQDYFEGA
jgi:hypothetical protein